jgi:hypothetical protein
MINEVLHRRKNVYPIVTIPQRTCIKKLKISCNAIVRYLGDVSVTLN